MLARTLTLPMDLFLFLGDNTTSAGSRVELGGASLQAARRWASLVT